MAIEEARKSISTNAACSIVIVDDAILQRGLITKFVNSDLKFECRGVFRSLKELDSAPDLDEPHVLLVSLRSPQAGDDERLAKYALRWNRTQLICCGLVQTELTRSNAAFKRRFSRVACGEAVRPSVVAKEMWDAVVQFQAQTQRTFPENTVTSPFANGAGTSPMPSSSLVGDRFDKLQSAPEHCTLIGNRPNSPTRRLASRLIVIGGSTGAPAAVTKVLQQLPADFPLPIMISLHMLEDFTERLAQSLSRASKLPCAEAGQGEMLQPGRVYIAKGDHHLTVIKNENGRLVSRLNRDAPEHFARPSVNQLFRSAAIAAGPATIAVMLTGIGCDGFEGTELLARRGAYIIAQDEASSTVWGMPAAVVSAGLAADVLPPVEIGQLIAQRVTIEQRSQVNRTQTTRH